MNKYLSFGFTLTELAIAVLLVSILALVLIPDFGRYPCGHLQNNASNNLKEILSLQNQYKEEKGYYAEGLKELNFTPIPFKYPLPSWQYMIGMRSQPEVVYKFGIDIDDKNLKITALLVKDTKVCEKGSDHRVLSYDGQSREIIRIKTCCP